MNVVKQITDAKKNIDLCLFSVNNNYYVAFNDKLSVAFVKLEDANEVFDVYIENSCGE